MVVSWLLMISASNRVHAQVLKPKRRTDGQGDQINPPFSRCFLRLSFPAGNETTEGFTGCSFENDTCDWLDVSTSKFQWLRNRNATLSENTGPSVDNTLGTELGTIFFFKAQ